MPKIAVVDGDTRLRAQLSHYFINNQIHVEPYESVHDLRDWFPDADVLLVRDQPNQLGDLFITLNDAKRWYPVVVYDEDPAARRVVDVIRMGAIDYLSLPLDETILDRRVLSILKNENHYATVGRKAFEARRSVNCLSAREAQVLGCVSLGLSNKEIARELDISPRTVEIHRANMQAKVRHSNFATPAEMAFYARLPLVAEIEGRELDLALSRKTD